MKTKITKRSNNAWQWVVVRNGFCLAAGWCRTEADAQNDAKVWVKSRGPFALLRNHVSGAISRGEAVAIAEKLT